MILTQPVWSPWGIGVVTPWSYDEDQVGRPLDDTYKLKPTPKDTKRSHSWGGLATFMQNTRYAQSFGQRPVKNDAMPVAGTDYQTNDHESEASTEASHSHSTAANASGVTSSTDGDDLAALTNADLDNATTLTIRNLPRKLTRKEFVRAIDSSGFAGSYDFVYLPHKFEKRENFGYGFVNFANVVGAQRFYAMWHGSRRFTIAGTSNLKPQAHAQTLGRPLNVSAARLQGRAANLKRSNANKFHRVMNNSFLPLVLASSVDDNNDDANR